MENNALQKEIFLVTRMAFGKRNASRDFPTTAMAEDNASAPEASCSTALLKDILPPEDEADRKDGKLFLWQLSIGDQFICADMSEEPFACDAYQSINPFLFFKCLCGS